MHAQRETKVSNPCAAYCGPYGNSVSCLNECLLCTASYAYDQGQFDGTATAGVAPNAPAWCFNAPVITPEWVSVEDAVAKAAALCPADLAFPVSYLPDGTPQNAVFLADTFPFRVPYDILQNSAPAVFNDRPYRAAQMSAVFPPIDTNCAALNGAFPGCSISGASNPNACRWQNAVLGPTSSGFTLTNPPLSPWVAYTDTCGDFAKSSCITQGSFCQRVSPDYSFFRPCCLKTLFDEIPTGSHSIWLSNTFWKHPSTVVSAALPTVNSVSSSITSLSFNPYSLYCDPNFCGQYSNLCDDVFAEVCAFSTTTWFSAALNTTVTTHVCLRPSDPAVPNPCRDWYTETLALGIATTHSLLALDGMVTAYCAGGTASSATAFGDSYSCMCETFSNLGASAIFYGSCSDIATCVDGVAPLVTAQVSAGSPPLVNVGNPVCSNPLCTIGRASLSTSFVTSNILTAALSCPQDTCLVYAAGTSVTIGNINGGSVYIDAGQLSCAQSISVPSPPAFKFETFSNFWFWDVAAGTLTNPDSQADFNIVNVTSNTAANTQVCGSVSFNPADAPPWISIATTSTQFQLFNFGEVFTFQLPLSGAAPPSEPTAAILPLTISGLGSDCNPIAGPGVNPTWIEPLQLNVLPVNNPPGKPPGPAIPGTANGVPIPVVPTDWTPGAIALVVLAIVLVAFAFYLVLNALRNNEVAQDALRWVKFNQTA